MSNIICICKNISEEAIVRAIKDGATTVSEVKEEAGATSGGCRGGRCSKKIADLIEANK